MKNNKFKILFLSTLLTLVLGTLTVQLLKVPHFKGQREIASSKKTVLIGLEGLSYGAIHFLVEILAQSSRSQPLFYDRLISFHSFS